MSTKTMLVVLAIGAALTVVAAITIAENGILSLPSASAQGNQTMGGGANMTTGGNMTAGNMTK
jgi:hypothetical protein